MRTKNYIYLDNFFGRVKYLNLVILNCDHHVYDDFNYLFVHSVSKPTD